MSPNLRVLNNNKSSVSQTCFTIISWGIQTSLLRFITLTCLTQLLIYTQRTWSLSQSFFHARFPVLRRKTWVLDNNRASSAKTKRSTSLKMHESHFIKIYHSIYFCAATLLCGNGSLQRCIARAKHKRQKIPVAWTEVVLLWIFYSWDNNKREKKQRFVQKAYTLYSVDLHFVSSTLNIHQYHSWHCSFVCLQRAASHSSLENNRPNDPSCIGNYAFRLQTQPILLFSSIVPSYL